MISFGSVYQSVRHPRFLLRGESVVSTLGVSSVVILLAMMTAVAWWSISEQNQLLNHARYDQVRAACNYVARSAETMLASDDVSELRRAVLDTTRDADLKECTIRLPDGRIIADAVPSRIQVVSLPRRWSSGPLDGNTKGAPVDGVVVSQSVLVPGRGAVIIEANAGPARRVGFSESQLVIGMVCIAGLGALLVVYRHNRAQVMTLGMIRDALVAMDKGEQTRDALGLPEGGPSFASAWNRLLNEQETARRRALALQSADVVNRPQRSEGELEGACNSLAMGMVILDERGVIRHANGAAASLLQFKRAESTGKPLESLISDASVREQLTVATGLQLQRRSVEIKRGEGDRQSVLRLALRPLRRDDGVGALLTIEDITQQRVAEASRNSFVTQATHELRTPLTNMRLCVEMALEDSARDAATSEKCFNQINHEVRRLERTVTEMLSVAEIEAGCLKLCYDDVRLENLFNEFRTDFEAQASQKGITLVFDLPPKLPVIQADHEKLVLALHNLIGNAIKYTPDGGRVTIAVHEADNRLVVEVSDTGIGIREEEYERIFERFYRAKDPRVGKITGSGLGLALTREVARFHNGEVTVHSQLDKGSTFTFTIPVAPKGVTT